jgi:hypothetical protein
MKKLLIITNVIWICVFYFKCCTPEPKPEPVSCNTISSNYTNVATSGRISPVEANTMADLYYAHHYPKYNINLEEYAGVDGVDLDARSVWFSLETLKQFLWEIESKSATCNGCEKLNLGVRIYYGEYAEPDTQKGDDPNTFPFTHKKMHSVFMVPTYAKHGPDGKLRDYDFNPNQLTVNIKGKEVGSKCQPITLMEYVKFAGPFKEGVNKVAFSNTLMAINFLDEKFILTPNPKSLVKTIAVDEMDKESENELNNEKDKNKGKVKKVTFNALNAVGGNYMFQNHGSLCPPNCVGEDYFAQ